MDELRPGALHFLHFDLPGTSTPGTMSVSLFTFLWHNASTRGILPSILSGSPFSGQCWWHMPSFLSRESMNDSSGFAASMARNSWPLAEILCTVCMDTYGIYGKNDLSKSWWTKSWHINETQRSMNIYEEHHRKQRFHQIQYGSQDINIYIYISIQSTIWS